MCLYMYIYMNIHIVYTYVHMQKRIYTKLVTLITSREGPQLGGESPKIVKACNVFKENVFVLRITNN